MSISVGFTTESKRENSTKQRTMSTTHNCLFKNGCSMLYPTLLLELDTDTFPSYTGFKIENRYYNVTDIKSVRQNLFEISGEVDVLATYKTEIGSATEYILRASSASDGNIIDTKYPTLANPVGLQQWLPNLEDDMYSKSGGYILGTISGDSESGVTYYLMGNAEFKDFLTYMFAGHYLTATDIGIDLQKELVNPFQYIASCMWFPFLDGTAQHFGTTVKFGFWDSQITATIVTESNREYRQADTIDLNVHPQAATRGNFLNGAPFTRRSLEVYGFGRIPLDTSFFVQNKSATIMVKVDKYTGIGELTVESIGGTVLKTQGQVGVPIKISQVTSPVMTPIVSAIGSVGNLLSENYVGAIKGIGNAIQQAMPQVQSSGFNGSKTDYSHAPRVVSQFYYIVDEDNATMGRPLCSPRQINTLSGFIQCENVDIQLACTSVERIKVIDFMENGFFYE